MTRLGSQKLHICPKVTKMGSIIGHSLDYDGVETLRGQRQITQQKLTQVNHPGNPSPEPQNFETAFQNALAPDQHESG